MHLRPRLEFQTMALMQPIADHDGAALGEAEAEEVMSAAQLEERRLQVRAYYAWLEAANGKAFPTLAEMEAADLPEMLHSSFVLDLREDVLSPQFLHIGEVLLEDCEAGTAERIKTPADVPARSLLSRLSEHYLQCFSNRAPIGFEAIYSDLRDDRVKYRGIILPLSSDGSEIDYVWGTVNGMVDDQDQADQPSSRKSPTKHNSRAQPATAHADGSIPPLKLDGEVLMSLEANLNSCLEIDGALAAALVDGASGMALATVGNPRGIDLNVAAAGNTNVMKAKEKTMKDLGLKDKIEDVLITLSTQYHLIRPLTDSSGKGLFIYLMLDKEKANLAMARFKLANIEKTVTV